MAFIRGTFLILSLFYLRHLIEGTLPNNNSKKTNGIFARNRNMPGNVDSGSKSKDLLPLVINTWNVTKAADGGISHILLSVDWLSDKNLSSRFIIGVIPVHPVVIPI